MFCCSVNIAVGCILLQRHYSGFAVWKSNLLFFLSWIVHMEKHIFLVVKTTVLKKVIVFVHWKSLPSLITCILIKKTLKSILQSGHNYLMTATAPFPLHLRILYHCRSAWVARTETHLAGFRWYWRWSCSHVWMQWSAYVLVNTRGKFYVYNGHVWVCCLICESDCTCLFESVGVRARMWGHGGLLLVV